MKIQTMIHMKLPQYLTYLNISAHIFPMYAKVLQNHIQTAPPAPQKSFLNFGTIYISFFKNIVYINLEPQMWDIDGIF